MEELDDSAGEGTTAFPTSLTTPPPPPTPASARKQLTIQTANLNNDRNKPQQEPTSITPTHFAKHQQVPSPPSSDSSSPSEDEEVAAISQIITRRKTGWRNKAHNKPSKSLQVEWNTPPEIANLIHEFAETFVGLSLDPCGNPDSNIDAKYSYGRIGESDEEFIDALTLTRWGVPGEGNVVDDPNTWSK